VGCYEKQALVLVNLGGATGGEVWNLAQEIKTSVKEKFGVDLDVEVNVI
jgi:UDP-N-acetylmuramate dehydrogenase